ncbi:MAG: hypothetical protein DI598_02625 [Pseudopedobacter saltans]|uniref:Uncharacterized protein n=1 Tax=Pseudopedobacter saltans TaxID=151895 RepID=A0A2W5FDE7_9SPHI|nr:MAG: hypothetical protein DI598_02625 [Pseudopedobacter saltans]
MLFGFVACGYPKGKYRCSRTYILGCSKI